MDGEFINKSFEVVGSTSKKVTVLTQTLKKDGVPYWSREEINKVIDSIESDRLRFLAKFLWMSGIRITEALSLRKCDINFQYYTMEIRWLKSRKYNTRIVPLHPNLRDMLQVYTAAMNDKDRVFPFSRQYVWRCFKRVCDGNPHKFRHSFAVNWLRSDGNIAILSRILGHSKLTTTQEYLKIVPVDQGKELLKIQF